MELTELKNFLDSEAGKTLKKYLVVKLNELGSIENISEKDTPTHQAIEIKAQKRAYQKLKEIFADIVIFSGEIEKKDPRDSFVI